MVVWIRTIVDGNGLQLGGLCLFTGKLWSSAGCQWWLLAGSIGCGWKMVFVQRKMVVFNRNMLVFNRKIIFFIGKQGHLIARCPSSPCFASGSFAFLAQLSVCYENMLSIRNYACVRYLTAAMTAAVLSWSRNHFGSSRHLKPDFEIQCHTEAACTAQLSQGGDIKIKKHKQ